MDRQRASERDTQRELNREREKCRERVQRDRKGQCRGDSERKKMRQIPYTDEWEAQ